MSLSEFRERILRAIRKNLSETSEGVVITIRVDADPRENYLIVENDELIFKTREYIDASRSNATLIGFLSRGLKIPSSRIDVVYGSRGGSIKRVLIRDIGIEELEQKLLKIVRLI